MFWNEEPITKMDVSNLRNRPNEWKKDDIARRKKVELSKPPAKKKPLLKQTQDTTPSLNLKRIFWERQAEVQKRIELIASGKEIWLIENEVETTQCKWCESDILQGRDYCSENCRRLYLTNSPIL